MKGIYIYYNDIDKKKLSGIDKKVMWQIEEFNSNSLSCKLHILDNGVENFLDRILLRLPFSNKSPRWSYTSVFENIDFIYFRRPSAITNKLIQTLKKIRINNPNIKIILEIPTYPYDNELKLNWYNFPLYLKDKHNRKKLKYVIDRIAIQNKIDELFGIPTIHFKNGININQITPRKPKQLVDIKIRICAVANMVPWQGYERVITSLAEYYKNNGQEEIEIHFVGEGPETEKYIKLSNYYKLGSRVIFHGYKTGDELDIIYNKCDLALDAFGRYKTKNKTSTSLKSREYVTKGLPVISGSKSDLFSKENDYYLEFPDNSSVFKFSEVVDFYHRIYNNKTKLEVTIEIHEYAKDVCDISKNFKDVVQYFKNDIT